MRTSRAVAADRLVERVAQLEARVEALERAHGPRAEQDAQLLGALAAAADGRPFTATAALARAGVDADLAAALDAAGILSGLELGAWLREVQGRPMGGLRAVRGKRTGGGFLWRVVV